MADLVLCDLLIDEYLKYKFDNNFDKEKTRKLLKLIQPFYLKDNHPIMKDPSMPMLLSSDPLIEIIDIVDNEELVKRSNLKLMVADNYTRESFTTLNINERNTKLGVRFGGIYPNRIDKDKAIKHIKDLLLDGDYVKVSDSYIDFNSSWSENKRILEEIIPKKNMDLIIESGSMRNRRPSLGGDKKNELNTICSDWNIRASQYNDNIQHDRYIETNKVKILLSSGLYNLSSSSNKDFAYIIDLKR